MVGLPDSPPLAGQASGDPVVLPVTFAIIGTGFSGLGAAIALRRAGYHDLVLLERADDVGGTWRDNTYPGCRCDVQSNLYSFSFAPKPDWSQTYPSQPELRAYLRKIAADYGVLRDIRFGHEVLAARWEDQAGRWRISTSQGEFSARYLIAGTGALVEPSLPDIPGIEKFAGTVLHSARWDAGWSARGRRVAVIGTGASAIQIVPVIQPEAEQVTVFQRTAPYVLPHNNRPVTPGDRVPDAAADPGQGRADVAGAHGAGHCRPRYASPADPGLPARLQARPAVERVLSGPGGGQRRPGHREDHRVHRRRRHHRRRGAPSGRH